MKTIARQMKRVRDAEILRQFDTDKEIAREISVEYDSKFETDRIRD